MIILETLANLDFFVRLMKVDNL